MPLVDVLIPTYRRKTGLAVVLTTLFGPTFGNFDVTVSNQTDEDEDYLESIETQTLVPALRWHGHGVRPARMNASVAVFVSSTRTTRVRPEEFVARKGRLAYSSRAQSELLR